MAGSLIDFQQDGIKVAGYLAEPSGTPAAGSS